MDAFIAYSRLEQNPHTELVTNTNVICTWDCGKILCSTDAGQKVKLSESGFKDYFKHNDFRELTCGRR